MGNTEAWTFGARMIKLKIDCIEFTYLRHLFNRAIPLKTPILIATPLLPFVSFLSPSFYLLYRTSVCPFPSLLIYFSNSPPMYVSQSLFFSFQDAIKKTFRGWANLLRIITLLTSMEHAMVSFNELCSWISSGESLTLIDNINWYFYLLIFFFKFAREMEVNKVWLYFAGSVKMKDTNTEWNHRASLFFTYQVIKVKKLISR